MKNEPRSKARLKPLVPGEWPAEMKAALKAIRPPNPRHPYPQTEGRPRGLNVLGTFAHHPALTAAWHTFNGHILFATSLTQRQRELVVLRVSALRDAPYEWAQHVVLAGDVGITPEEIERVVQGPDAPGWAPLEQAMLRATDELIAAARISGPTWAQLALELDEEQLMDLVFTVGAYETLAMAFNSFGLELDDDLKAT